MQIKLLDLANYIHEYLQVDKFNDYCPNGLQVESNEHVSKIALGVSACQELFIEAEKRKADLIIVHHGLFWGEAKPLTGVLGKRVKTLFDHKISLMAYHLPLDAHPVIGNNAVLARLLKLEETKPFMKYKGQLIGIKGRINATSFEEFSEFTNSVAGPLYAKIKGGDHPIINVGIVSGGASSEVEDAYEENIDLYITGEIGEPTKAYCEEGNIHYIALGHYNSEQWGIKALGQELSANFGIETEFIKIDNPH